MQKRPAILIIRMSALGDVAMTIPVIYSFAQQYPQWQVKVLTQAFFTQLFINKPSNISFISVDLKQYRGIKGIFKLINLLRKEEFDTVADFHNVLRSLCIDCYFYLSGKTISIVKKNRTERKKLTRRKNKCPAEQKNYIRRYIDVLSSLGLPVVPTFSSLYEGRLEIPEYLPDISPKENSQWIGIAPFARYPNKTYSLTYMEKVIQYFSSKEEGYKVFLFGGGTSEIQLLKAWEVKYPSVITLAGKLTLSQELSLMANLDVMVSMDSANMHLASLVSIPVISIWGGTTPLCGFLGWKQKKENAVYANLPCQPCTISGSTTCYRKDFKCVNHISPEIIIDKIHQLLKQK